ncbi:hypothetical protein C2I27_04495 [Priestia megaterium]|nr:hypothetical protein C2I27_04495 [Priestia megaterium]
MDNNELLAVVSLPGETFYHTGTSVRPVYLWLEKVEVQMKTTVFMAMCIMSDGISVENTENSDLPSIFELILIQAYHIYRSTSMYKAS